MHDRDHDRRRCPAFRHHTEDDCGACKARDHHERGRWQLEPSVGGYVRHLREVAAWRGGNDGEQARAGLGAAQADLAEAKAAKLRGELVEAKWSSTCRAIRARVLAVADRMRDLPARQHVKLSRELRDALTDLSEGKA